MKKLLLVAAMFGVSGCTSTMQCSDDKKCSSTIVSKSVETGDKPDAGVLYAIPRQNLQLSIVRSPVTKKKLAANVEDTKKAENDLSTQVKAKAAQIKDLDTMAAAAKDSAKAKLTLELEVAKLQKLLLDKKLANAGRALIDAKNALGDFQANPVNFEDKITLKVLAPYPDSNNQFIAQPNRGPFSADTIEIKTTAAGLLSGGNGKSEGQLDEILVKVAQAYASLGADAPEVNNKTAQPYFAEDILKARKAVAAKSKEEIEELQRCLQNEGQFSYEIDLRNDGWGSDLTAQMKKSAFCYSFTLVSPKSMAQVNDVKGSYDGLMYPRKTTVHFKLHDNVKNKFVKSLFASVIDGRTLGYIPLPRGVFATNEQEFEFKDGLLTRYKSITQNELVEVFALIPRIGRALMSIPTEMLKFKVDYSNQEAAYYQASEAAMAARLSYEAALASQAAQSED